MRPTTISGSETRSEEGPRGLLARAISLIEGDTTGLAALLNLVRAPDFPEDLAEHGAAAFLVEESTEPWSTRPKAGLSKPSPIEQRHRLLVRLSWALVALAAAGLIGYLIYRRVRL